MILYPLELNAGNVSSLQAFGAFHYFKLNGITFSKGLEAVAVDSGKVNENVLATILLQKTKTLAVIEPLYPTCCHTLLLLQRSAGL